jgi:hypothetical protein
VIALAGCGGGHGGQKEQRVCAHGADLCDAKGGESTCMDQVHDLEQTLGDAYGKTLDCGLEANSCAEFAGCFIGGLGKSFEDTGRDLGKGVDKVMGHDHGGDSSLDLASCREFHTESANGGQTARWDGCSDRVRREVTCKPFMDSFQCQCLEDGVERWSFDATRPPLDDRDAAARVAKANCKMGFGN